MSIEIRTPLEKELAQALAILTLENARLRKLIESKPKPFYPDINHCVGDNRIDTSLGVA